MNYLSVSELSKSFGEYKLFNKVSFGLEKGQKVGLVAKNGAGKSTLFKILMDKEIQDNETGVQVANLLFDLVKTTGMTMLLVTHNTEMAGRCSRQMTLQYGTFQ